MTVNLLNYQLESTRAAYQLWQSMAPYHVSELGAKSAFSDWEHCCWIFTVSRGWGGCTYLARIGASVTMKKIHWWLLAKCSWSSLGTKEFWRRVHRASQLTTSLTELSLVRSLHLWLGARSAQYYWLNLRGLSLYYKFFWGRRQVKLMWHRWRSFVLMFVGQPLG